MEPALHIIAMFGGAEAVAEITGVTNDAVYRWTYPRDKRGSDGFIPAKHHMTLVDAAKKKKLPLRLESFYPSAAHD